MTELKQQKKDTTKNKNKMKTERGRRETKKIGMKNRGKKEQQLFLSFLVSEQIKTNMLSSDVCVDRFLLGHNEERASELKMKVLERTMILSTKVMKVEMKKSL